jgi:hypothetical protein
MEQTRGNWRVGLLELQPAHLTNIDAFLLRDQSSRGSCALLTERCVAMKRVALSLARCVALVFATCAEGQKVLYGVAVPRKGPADKSSTPELAWQDYAKLLSTCPEKRHCPTTVLPANYFLAA